MEHIGKNTEITQAGQAIRINLSAFTGLCALFSPVIGPNGSAKMLVSPSGVRILRDGRSLLDSIMFIHPITTIINKAAIQNHDMLGDGVCTFVVFSALVFQQAYALIANGENVLRVNEQILRDLNRLLSIMDSEKCALAKDDVRNVLFYVLNTKMDEDVARHFVDVAIRAYRADMHMVEIVKMDGDILQSKVVDGLVLDHGGRHPCMPRHVEKACILISNMSLEYEKPEVSTDLYFRSAVERDRLVAGERAVIDKRIDRILELKRSVEGMGKQLVLMTERGIDLPSLDRLQGMLCLRRVKRRNLERLLRLCGGKLVTTIDDVRADALGYAGSIRMREEKDRSYTFVEKTPYTGSATVLVYGNNRFETDRVHTAVKSALKIVSIAQATPFCIRGGASNYQRWSGMLSSENGRRTAVSEALYQLGRMVGGASADVVDCYAGLSRTLFNAGMVSSTLLMVDEIIKAGKSVKEEKDDGKH